MKLQGEIFQKIINKIMNLFTNNKARMIILKQKTHKPSTTG